MGIISAALVIARRLSKTTTKPGMLEGRRRVIATDLIIGLIFPLAQLLICRSRKPNRTTSVVDPSSVFFIQGHRFDIYEGAGCIEAIPLTILRYCLNLCWPIGLGLASAIYCCEEMSIAPEESLDTNSLLVRTLQALYQRRADIHDIVTSCSGMTYRRYYRLVLLCVAEIIFTVPLASKLCQDGRHAKAVILSMSCNDQ